VRHRENSRWQGTEKSEKRLGGIHKNKKRLEKKPVSKNQTRINHLGREKRFQIEGNPHLCLQYRGKRERNSFKASSSSFAKNSRPSMRGKKGVSPKKSTFQHAKPRKTKLVAANRLGIERQKASRGREDDIYGKRHKKKNAGLVQSGRQS